MKEVQRSSISALLGLLCCSVALAQDTRPSSAIAGGTTSVVAPQGHGTPNDTYVSHAGFFCGTGASTSSVSTRPTLGCGAGLTVHPLPLFAEVGVMGPQANRSNVTGYLSLDYHIALARNRYRCLPGAILGYSRLFETGHALDYGVALSLPRPHAHKGETGSMRLELREYWTFASPSQHNIMLRIGWMSLETD